MSCKGLWNIFFGIFYTEPVVARGQWVAFKGSIPPLAAWAELLEQLTIAIKDIDTRRWIVIGQTDDVPGVVIAIVVRGHKAWVVHHSDIHRHRATTLNIGDGHLVGARSHILKHTAVLQVAPI